MLVLETIARTRREPFIKGKTLKEIARDLAGSRNTVRRIPLQAAGAATAKVGALGVGNFGSALSGNQHSECQANIMVRKEAGTFSELTQYPISSLKWLRRIVS